MHIISAMAIRTIVRFYLSRNRMHTFTNCGTKVSLYIEHMEPWNWQNLYIYLISLRLGKQGHTIENVWISVRDGETVGKNKTFARSIRG